MDGCSRRAASPRRRRTPIARPLQKACAAMAEKTAAASTTAATDKPGAAVQAGAPDKLTAAAERVGVPAPTVRLDDKYRLESGRVFLSGAQALVRLPLMQRQLDTAAGLETGCFISGYRGSPLGGYDSQLWAAKRLPGRRAGAVHPGRQRGPGGDGRLGVAAGRRVRRLRLRRGVRRLVRQGPGRRPLRRRAAPRQHGGHRAPRRRAGARGRRPHGEVLHHRASVRARADGRHDPGAQSRRACRRSWTTA